MAKFHFVEDYQRMVRTLLAKHPLDEAMSLAVGGNYEEVGHVEAELLRHFGLRDGMAVLDFGCGSGRLGHALGKTMKLRYLGIDVVQELLDYADSKTPHSYAFLLHHGLDLPVKSACLDFVVAFSVFTHLLHTESFIYLQEMRRALRPGGQVVFSFLEFAEPTHWNTFAASVAMQKKSTLPHLNSFLERPAISLWAEKLGFSVETFVGATEAPWGGAPLTQALAVLRKPLAA